MSSVDKARKHLEPRLLAHIRLVGPNDGTLSPRDSHCLCQCLASEPPEWRSGLQGIYLYSRLFAGKFRDEFALDSPHRHKTNMLNTLPRLCLSPITRSQPPGPHPGPDSQASARSRTAREIRTFQEERIDRLLGGRKNLDAIPGAYQQDFCGLGHCLSGAQDDTALAV